MQEPRLTTAFLPDWIGDSKLFGRTAVVIDILRASTTMIHALANGAAEVAPCLEIDQARRLADELRVEHSRVIVGGERGGVRVEGFDLGNSPAEYTTDIVGDAHIVFSTTNGTRAIDRCEGVADEIWIGGFANLGRLSNALIDRPAIALICAGTNGAVSREDVLFAGAAANELLALEPNLDLDDCTQLALDAWRAVASEPLVDALAESQGGRNLRRIGQDADIAIAAEVDSHKILPKYRNGRIFTHV